jgi:MarR family transcriptional regulator, lower aerobic nicotinate degradation pathway regulator
MATTPTSSIAARAADDDARLPYGLLLARLGQESVARFRRALKPLGLNTQQFFVLRQLQAIGAASQASLADALGIDYSNLATITAELNDRGLIERYRHESDRRRYVVELSESGAALCAEASNAIADGEEALLSTLEESDRERLWTLLREVADAASLCPRDEEETERVCNEVHAEADRQSDLDPETQAA